MKVEDEEMNSQMPKFISFHIIKLQKTKENNCLLCFSISINSLAYRIYTIGHGRHLDHPSKYRVLIFIV